MNDVMMPLAANESIALTTYAEKAYLDYSMYCLLYTSDAADD